MYRLAVAVVLVALTGATAQKSAGSDSAAAPAAAPATPAVAASVLVERGAVCTGIEDREPAGAAESFAADVGKLYCFTHIKGVTDTLTVEHKWYHGDALRGTVTLKVKSASWRTYSSKTIDALWKGTWRVDVVNGETGDVMKSLPFKVE